MRKQFAQLSLAALSMLPTIAITASSTGCSAVVGVEDVEQKVIGKWAATDKAWHIEFSRGGLIRMSTTGPPKPGKYRINDGVLFVDLDDGSRFKAKIEFLREGKLMLTDTDGSFTTFSRVE